MSDIMVIKKPHEPKDTILVHGVKQINDKVRLIVRIGMTSVSENRFKVWYSPIVWNKSTLENKTYIECPPDGFSIERVVTLASAIEAMLNINIGAILSQLTEDINNQIAEQKILEAVISEHKN